MHKAYNDELTFVIRQCRQHFWTALIFSLAINVLYLAAPLYMLQVYDRVITSGSEITLLMLTLILLLTLAALSGLDFVRARILTRASVRLDRLLSQRIVSATLQSIVRFSSTAHSPIRDFDTFRQFVTGTGIQALFDLPWAPIYILIIFMLHPALGAFAFSCAIILILMALLNERILKTPFADSSEAGARNYKFTEMTLRNAEVVQAMGMLPGLLHRWSNDRHLALQKQSSASDRAAAVQSTIRFFRLAMQSLILGLGAFLVIEKFITVGAMFAGSILLGRALQPIEQIVGSWRTLITAKSAYRRIKQLLLDNPTPATSLELPKPLGQLCVEKLNYVAPGTNHHILKNINFELEPGKLLGIVGPSGAGKSTLSRQLIGILAPSTGAVRLDGADVSKWNRDLLGRYIGYLPQDIELFDDTVAANISRFRTESDAEVIEAARLAGVHEMILRLPSGYETQIGDNSAVLSGGYRQRIGLARAVFGNPSLVVLDEPSSNLDTDGDIALLACLTDLKRRGAAVVIISHRTNTLGVVDRLLVLKDGAAEISGPRDEVIARVTKLTKPFRNVANPLSA